MRVLITGGAGFMGRNLFNYLQTIEDLPDLKQLDLYYGQDLLRWEDVEKAWLWNPDIVINFASFTHVDTSIDEPCTFWENNLGLMRNVLEICRKHDTRLLQVSSCEVYGTAQYLPMDEHHPLNPQSPYAFTKCAQDRACYAWWKTYGLNVSIVRPFNNYGPYQQREKLIAKFIYNIWHRQPLPVYGEGKAKRDWLYVRDCVSGIWTAANKLDAGEIVNLASGKSWSIMEVVSLLKETFLKVSNLLPYEIDMDKFLTMEPAVEHVDDRLGHVFHLEGSYEKAKELLGWEPTTTFAKGLEETFHWYVDNKFATPISRPKLS